MRSALFVAAILLSVGAQAQILFDSVADFSGTQGHNNLYYGYYNKTLDGGASAVYNHTTDFTLMSTFASSHSLQAFATAPAWVVDDRVGGVWTMLWANGGHGNGILTSGGRQSVEHFAIRRWISNFNGVIQLSGKLAKLDPSTSGNGTALLLYKNSVNIAATGPVTTLSGVTYSVQTNVIVGDVLDFFLDPYAANDLGDSSMLTATGEVVPEPATLLMSAVAAATVFRKKVSKRKSKASTQPEV